MDIISIVLIVCIAVFAVIGLIVGLVKGYSRVRSWASEYLLAGVVSIALGVVITKYSSLANYINGAITFGVSIVCVVLFIGLCAGVRKFMKVRIERRRQLSYYKNYEEQEDNTEKVLAALDSDDKESYKKYSRRKFSQSGGGWNALDKIFGGITLAVKGAVLAGVIIAIALTVIDFTTLAADGGKLNALFGPIYQSSAWEFFKPYLFDFFIVGILTICIKSGYASGISSALWTLFVLAMVGGAAMLSWYLAFNVQEFVTVAEALGSNLESVLANAQPVMDTLGITAVTVAQYIITAGLFILMLVVIILIAIFVPKLIDKARDGKAFSIIDGILGAIFLTVVVFAILFALGAVVQSLYDYEFMEVFNAYFDKSYIAKFIYGNNILCELNLINIPVDSWLTKQPEVEPEVQPDPQP